MESTRPKFRLVEDVCGNNVLMRSLDVLLPQDPSSCSIKSFRLVTELPDTPCIVGRPDKFERRCGSFAFDRTRFIFELDAFSNFFG
mmetsp:Transcript_6204/g.9638  ORF Transcript_6204/g.9638 Transcript_6204/m.9638 type:complete len:86 (+) Transcript_6204:96-353(+)